MVIKKFKFKIKLRNTMRSEKLYKKNKKENEDKQEINFNISAICSGSISG